MNYHKIDICNMDNGTGLRVVLWVSGCNHCCKGCFNSQTGDPASGGKFDDEAFAAIDNALSQSWCSGITLSGGDPLFPQNRAAIRDLCLKIKKTTQLKQFGYILVIHLKSLLPQMMWLCGKYYI